MSDDGERYVEAICDHLTNEVLAVHPDYPADRDVIYRVILVKTQGKLLDGHRVGARIAQEILESAFGALPSLGRGVDALVDSGRRRQRVWNAASEAAYEHDQFLTELLAPASEDETTEQMMKRRTSAVINSIERDTDHAVQQNRSVALLFLLSFMVFAGAALVILGAVLDQWVAAIATMVGTAVGCYLGAKSFDPYDR